MRTTVGQMTPSELRDLVKSIIEQKLLEILSDPDQGLNIEEALVERLVRPGAEDSAGER